MKRARTWFVAGLLAAGACAASSSPVQAADAFSPDFVLPAERSAVFDNDGTLWAEQPMYVKLLFMLDRVQALAPQHPCPGRPPPHSQIQRSAPTCTSQSAPP